MRPAVTSIGSGLFDIWIAATKTISIKLHRLTPQKMTTNLHLC
jgi:hypothetical protein